MNAAGMSDSNFLPQAALKRLQGQMRRRAEAGEWAAFGDLMQQHATLLESLPVAEMRTALENAIVLLADVAKSARADRDEVAARIAGLRKRQRVGDYYTGNGGGRFPR